jgi:hypothetical protein
LLTAWKGGKNILNRPKAITELEGLEAQKAVERHLQVQVDKPCAAAYLNGNILPQAGERSIRFFALAAELRRIGQTKEEALSLLLGYYKRLPFDVTRAPGSDGLPFTEAEVKGAVNGAYNSEAVKSYGCKSGIWQAACSGKEHCLFYKQLSHKSPKKGAGKTAYYDFLQWLGAVDKKGQKVLYEADIRVYFALDMIERRRSYKPGALLYVSRQELAQAAGVTTRAISQALERLFWHGLIRYQKGQPREKGQPKQQTRAGAIQRVLPVPIPGEGEMNSFQRGTE